jgi:hypothetical protein
MTQDSSARFDTDKEDHGYLPAYRKIVKKIGPEGRVCELGVYYGGSLAMWQVFFPQGIVVGVDCDERAIWPEGTVKVLSNHVDPRLVPTLRNIAPDGYDLFVDDGSHIGELAEKSFDLFWGLVKPGGWYVIEDYLSGQHLMRQSPEKFIGRMRLQYTEIVPLGIESIKYTATGLIIIRKAAA